MEWENIIFAVVVVLGSMLVIYLLNIISGFSRLANAFKYNGRFKGNTLLFQSVTIGAVPYQKSLIIGMNTEGLYFASLIFPKFISPAILIPWKYLRITMTAVWKFKYLDIDVDIKDSVRIRLNGRLFGELQKYVGS